MPATYATSVTPSITDVVERALTSYATLAELGETVEDEWQYVTDLSTAWRARLSAVAGEAAGAPAPDAVVAAVERAIQEIALIDDPHKAIDWLSTFPQIVLLALGRPDAPPPAAR